MKLIASDYDGTLKIGKLVSEEDKLALKAWKEAGNLAVIDTGRSMESFQMEAKKNGLTFDYYITNNGGMVYDKQLNCIFASYLPIEVGLEIMKGVKDKEGVVSYVANDGFYRHRIIINEQLEEHRYPDLAPNISEEELFSLGKYAQLVISFESMELAKAAEGVYRAKYGEFIEAYANKYVVDIVPKGISKATGLKLVCDQEKIKIEDVYTIGDADNDIDLIQFGINGGVMSIAQESVKAYAKREYTCVSALIKEILK
ncbi:MAG: HAD family phosphatase [Erysipelotrichaceae bacterium]|nr:HAD family phosphatase [Erysipelotrichaceae bacterium]